MGDYDDPFAEPNDTEKTVIRPNPGGRRPATPQPFQQPVAQPEATPMATGSDAFGVPQASAPAAAAPVNAGKATQVAMTGMNQLTACASTLFALISRIRNRAQHMDPDKLRQSVVAEVRGFENRALQAGVTAQTVKIARYAMCATLDDVVLNTPWGGQSSWGLQSMVGTFHRETVGGDRFYDLLARLEKEPGGNIDMLEFLYMCMSLGFEGRLRIEQGGSEKHMQIRGALARIIRAQRGPVERDLAPHWQGLKKPFKALSAWRLVWISLIVTAVLLGLQFVGLSWALSNQTERVVGQLSIVDSGPVATLERTAPPPPPAPPAPEVIDQVAKVSGFLEPEIAEGLIEVFQKGNTLTIRVAGSGMFGSGSDRLKPEIESRIIRLAQSLNSEKGALIVVGHSDNVPIRSSRFPSNMHLSLARAKSVMAEMAKVLDDPSRLSAEGRADNEPLADNGSKDGRARNRRIEVLLVQESDT
ncbi:type IVB secretion system protein IcmH/DotU [Parasedimentitalea psychrophila]|uniref:Type IVB secretion system protein IcmH/DotU n=1 Tax=Parasedimentitalea psychrophila TaxID=2997337 RepID=A0A9Y2L445_9RHOB|nr:type IVB secretion system protein IcmH/DotU [Parasedimentitalea psychrophila]WIY27758.1 type IVB secretion system protein IcmH/DotU [Parasedimentitalea psychrophila]